MKSFLFFKFSISVIVLFFVFGAFFVMAQTDPVSIDVGVQATVSSPGGGGGGGLGDMGGA